MDLMAPSFPRMGLESRGCKREPPKVPFVGAGDSEGERVGEMLERRGEERGRERSQAGGGCLPLCACPSPAAGTLDRNNKKRSTSLARPWLC